MPNPTRTGVSVYTWGTETYGSGLKNFSDTFLWGGNVGHTAILLTLPNTEENRQLVQEYLEINPSEEQQGNDKPFCRIKKYETKKIDLSEGKPKLTGETAFEEEVIEVYFSFWPSPTHGFTFQKFPDDTRNERYGVHVNYDPEKVKNLGLKPEKRRAPLSISSYFYRQEITLAPKTVAHYMGTTSLETLLLDSYVKLIHLKDKIDSLELLHKKIENKAKNEPISQTEKLLIEKLFPNLKESLIKEDILDHIEKEKRILQGQYDYFFLNISILL